MRKLSIIFLLVVLLAVGIAQAEQYEVAPEGTKVFTTETYLVPGQEFCFDIYLTGVAVPQNAGGAWIDFSNSLDLLSYVSAGRALNTGWEGVYGPWPPGGELTLPPDLPGIILMAVADLGSGAPPDADGDLIVGQVCLACTGPGDAFVNITTIPGLATWLPADDAIINTNTTQPVLTIHQVCECMTDEDCQDGLWCTGYEFCDFPGCGECIPGTPPCNDGSGCTLDICIEPDPLCGTPGVNCEEGSSYGDGTCENPCDVFNLAGSSDPCCSNPACLDEPICLGNDTDMDGIENSFDNCAETPNGPYRGACTSGSTGEPCITPGLNESECGVDGFCSMNQEDTYPPMGNGIGDACECEADFNCDGNVDAGDVTAFLIDFGRSTFFRPCTNGEPCNGDFNCDTNVDAADVTKFLEDFGRSEFFNPCPVCSQGYYCDGLYSCMSNDDCNYLSYCEKHTGQCSDEGQCVLKPGICVDPEDPVCGCDGVTYFNDCVASAFGISINHWGECVE